ncbi:hypothetical protein QYE76_041844 [Lolium multiflorum]|uniref:Uncharacterized protein n=1 Tax=Lolium multiflorum TaxID=4521 RepID=A0AAD8TG56_LOLMU|nr:hypothetical protein QYE76_041844 [Lolium multiflorum]
MARSINESGSSWVFPDGPLEEIASRCDVITAASLVGSCKFYHDSATQSVALPASQPFGMPCVLHTHQTEVPPAHNPFSRVHKFKQQGAQKDKQHDAKDRKGTLCQLTPLDRISSDAVIPDGGTGMWAGANGDWIALLGFPWNWELVNVYTGRRIPLPPISEFKSTPDKLVFESNDQHLQLLKIAICRVPTAASNYTSFSVLAIFNAAIAVLHCASSRWTVLDNQFLALCRGGGDGHLEALTGDNIDLIAAHLDVTYTVRLAACSRELYDQISKDEGKMHHWDEPCLLMPPPAYWFGEHWDLATASRLHDTVYDLVPLDHPRRSVALPFMHDRKWLGANGDWIAAADHHGWCLVNVYTERHIPLPSLPDSKIHHSIVSYRPAYSFNWGPAIDLLKIVICQVPTKGGRYADYKLIALFDKTIFYLEGGGDWRMLEALTPAPDYPNYCDAIELRGHVFAVDETDGSTYFWDTANAASDTYFANVTRLGVSYKEHFFLVKLHALKKKVESLEKLVAEKPVENTEMMNKLLDEKIRQIIPPGLMEGLAAWNAGGQVGPIHVPSISGSNSSFHVSPTVPLHPTPASGLHQTPPQLQPPPQLQLVASTPPTAALVSTVAEIDAIKEDEQCILLQTVEPGGKLVEVASGLVMASRVMHGARLAEDVAKVKLIRGGGLPSAKKSTGATSPIIRPKIASADDTLKETAVAAPTTLKEPAVAAATRKEPTIAATTTRHKQLLGALPQRPSTRRTVRQAAASQPPPPKVQDMAPLDGNDVDDDDDIDAYINTGACSQDMYMPPMDEQAFRTHGDQLGRPPTVTKQRLVFTGLSQDTPPEAGNPAQVKPATVFSPNTLRKTIIGEPPKSTPATSEAPPAPPVGQVKKARKRGAKKGASSSQPAPKRIRADDMVPPTPDGLPRCHEAGKPILPPDMEHLASGPMLPLQHSINYLESVLLKEKDPNYPVFSVKVPSDQNFVNEDPADIFFIAFEDVFNLFHSKRLDYNLVRLYAINLQMKINRERPRHIAVADPYYMRDSQLQDGSRTRTKAVRYLQNFMLMYKESNTILLPVFPEDKYCTLIILDPKWSLAQYFDSSSTTTKKDYKRIRGVLDEAILGYSKNGGTFDKNGQYIRPDTKKIGFKHVINFPCIKQPAGSIKEAFYVLHHLKGFVEDAEMMSLPPKMTYYVVFEGRVPGVYEEWEECKKQVHKFSGNCYKGYPTRHEAVAKWRAHQSNKSKMKTFLVLSLLLTIVAAVLYFILV